MDDLIIVDRQDGRAVAGLVSAVLTQWDAIPLPAQAAIIEQASLAAFDRMGVPNGRYVVTAFILKHRAAMARRARAGADLGRRSRSPLRRVTERPRKMFEAVIQSRMGTWLTAFRRAA